MTPANTKHIHTRHALLRDLVDLETAESRGDYPRALHLSEIFLAATTDPSLRCPSLLARARAFEGSGRLKDAISTLKSVRDNCAEDPTSSARGLFTLGRMVATRRTDPSEAIPLLSLAITRFPDDPIAKRAVVWLIDIARERRGAPAAIGLLRDLYRQVGDRDIGPCLLFQAAGLVGQSPVTRSALRIGPYCGPGCIPPGRVAAPRNGVNVGQDYASAISGTPRLAGRAHPKPRYGSHSQHAPREDRIARLALYYLIVTGHPESHLADDARIEAARICLSLGRPWDAVRLAKDVLASRETSWLIGSYELPLYPKAAMVLGEAILAATGDPEAAADEFLWFAGEFPSGPEHPVALLKAHLLLESAGRHGKSREILARLAREYPHSGEGRKARELLEAENARK